LLDRSSTHHTLVYTTALEDNACRNRCASGGFSLIIMQGPDGQEMPTRGIYREVVPNERLVLTDAFVTAWEPSEKPFMTGILTFEDEGAKTRYTAKVRHWTTDNRNRHEEMGFHQGWGIATDQLEALAKSI
jgi:uncharacterized protein YndB with AHSA1/START domain